MGGGGGRKKRQSYTRVKVNPLSPSKTHNPIWAISSFSIFFFYHVSNKPLMSFCPLSLLSSHHTGFYIYGKTVVAAADIPSSSSFSSSASTDPPWLDLKWKNIHKDQGYRGFYSSPLSPKPAPHPPKLGHTVLHAWAMSGGQSGTRTCV